MSEDEKRRWRSRAITTPGGERKLVERVRKRSAKRSSREWIERQINDPYVQRARAEGYRSRSAFKLIELDERFHVIKSGSRVVDLGAAPGGWTQATLKRGARSVVGIDLLKIDALEGAKFLEMDFLVPEAPAALLEALGARPDLVLCDMAANTTGHARTDQLKTGALAEAAAEFAITNLVSRGGFVTKAFQGGLEADLLARLKRSFAVVRHAKPPASRAESAEIYVVATGFRG